MAMSPEDALDHALDQALDALLAGTPGTTAMSGLAGLAGAVRAAVATEPSPQTRARHQRVLMDEAARLAGPQAVAGRQGAAVRPRRLRRRLVAVAAVLAALIVVGAPASAALAANAQPGQALYSIKLATENVELAFQRNPQKKVALRLKFAEERIAEMTTLVARGRTGQVPGVATRLASEQDQVDAAISGLQASGKAPAALLRSVIRMLADHARKLSALAQSSGCGLHPRTAACRQLLRARAGTVRLARRVAQAAGVAPPT